MIVFSRSDVRFIKDNLKENGFNFDELCNVPAWQDKEANEKFNFELFKAVSCLRNVHIPSIELGTASQFEKVKWFYLLKNNACFTYTKTFRKETIVFNKFEKKFYVMNHEGIKPIKDEFIDEEINTFYSKIGPDLCKEEDGFIDFWKVNRAIYCSTSFNKYVSMYSIHRCMFKWIEELEELFE